MKHVLQFDLEDGRPIFVEVEDQPGAGGQQRLGRGEYGIEKAETHFTDAIAQIKPAAEAVLQALHAMHTPEEIRLEFGIKFNAKAVAIIASVDSEATFKVSLKWTNKTERG